MKIAWIIYQFQNIFTEKDCPKKEEVFLLNFIL